MTTFYVMRHGETEWNVRKVMQGHEDSPLTEAGIAQIKERAQELAHVHFDQVFSSDLMRAQRTAELMTVERQLAINTTRLLRERAFGKYEGKTHAQFEAENRALIEKFTNLSEAEKRQFKYASDMESFDEVISRLLTFLREVAVAYPEQTILVVTHGGVLRNLLRHLGDPLADGIIMNTAYIAVETDGVEFITKKIHGISAD